MPPKTSPAIEWLPSQSLRGGTHEKSHFNEEQTVPAMKEHAEGFPVELAAEQELFRTPRLYQLLRREGFMVNYKQVEVPTARRACGFASERGSG